MAKKPAKKSAKKKEKPDAGDIAAPRKTARRRPPEPVAEEPLIETATHGEMLIRYVGVQDMPNLVNAVGRLADEVHALGRVRVTGAAHTGTVTTLHIVLPDHPLPYEQYPGLILSIDTRDNMVSFDHLVLGHVSPDLINDAAFAMLTAMRPDEGETANVAGRRADWFERAEMAGEAVADMHARL